MSSVRAELDLTAEERLLTAARTPEGAVVAATDLALLLPREGGHQRVPWESIDHASWNDGVLSVRESSGARHRVSLRDPESVPETVQERITATIVISSYHRLSRGGGVRIAGRRAPRSGALQWTFVFDAGLDPDDPGLRAEAEQHLEELRRQTGL